MLANISPEDKNKQDEAICNRLKQYIDTYNIWAVFIPF